MAKRKKTSKASAVDPLILAMKRQLEVMSKERDKLRDMVDECESVLDSWEIGCDDMETAMLQLQEVVDKFSEYV